MPDTYYDFSPFPEPYFVPSAEWNLVCFRADPASTEQFLNKFGFDFLQTHYDSVCCVIWKKEIIQGITSEIEWRINIFSFFAIINIICANFIRVFMPF